MNKKIFGFIAILYISLAACSDYQKVLKSGDPEKKYTMANTLYEKEDYTRALSLYEILMNLYKGTDKGEEVMYKYANCYYLTDDYIMAGYYFRKFAATYPASERTEEALFLSAYCYFLDSPRPSLDQENTEKAIRELQLFIRRFPNSTRVAECNDLIDKLRSKLEQKSYESSRLYYDLGYFKSANIALRNSMNKFPDSKYTEMTNYLLVLSNYELAKTSIESKQKERFTNTLKEYKSFKERFPQSQFAKDADDIAKDCEKQLNKMNKKNS